MVQRPDKHPPRPADGARSRAVQSHRSRLAWLLPVLPLFGALMLVSWPTPPAATGATPVFAAAFPTAEDVARTTRLTPAGPPGPSEEFAGPFGPSDELAETADLLALSFEVPGRPRPAPPAAASAPLDPPTPPAPSEDSPSTEDASPRAAGPAPEPTVAPRPTPTPEPPPQPSPTPTASPTPAPTAVPTAAPTTAPTVAAGPPPIEAAPTVSLTPREILLLGAMNDARVTAGLSPVTPRDDLTGVARARSEEMIRLDYFAHFHPDGRSAYQLLAEEGITFSAAGENLVKTFGDVQHSVDIGFQALWDSPTHQANILKPTYTRVGVGSHTSDDGTTIITTIFTDR